MRALNWLAGHPVVERIGWALIHSLWQGAAIALVLGILLWSLRRSDARLRYACACLALFSFTLCPPATYCLLVRASGPIRTALPGSAVAAPASTSSLASTNPELQNDSAASQAALAGVVVLWLGGSLVLSVRLFGGWSRLRRLRDTGATAGNDIRNRVHALAARIGIERAIRVRITTEAEAPSTFGWIRPTLLLPAAALSGLSTAQVDAILAHELAHIWRADYLVNLWQTAAETLFYYHPAIWWISASIRREREFCCDDIAVRLTGDPAAYVAALATLEEMRPMALVPRLAATGGPLLERVRRLLGYPAGRTTERGVIAAPVLATVGITGALAAGIWAAGPAFGRTVQEPVPPKPPAVPAPVSLPAPPAVPAAPAAPKPGTAGLDAEPAVPPTPAKPARPVAIAFPAMPEHAASLDVVEPPVALAFTQDGDTRRDLTDDETAALRRARKAQRDAVAAERDALKKLEEAREAQRDAAREEAQARREDIRTRIRRNRSADETDAEAKARRTSSRAEDVQAKGEAAQADALKREQAAASRLDPEYQEKTPQREDTTSANTARDLLQRAQEKEARSQDVLETVRRSRAEEARRVQRDVLDRIGQTRSDKLRAERDALRAERDALRALQERRATEGRSADDANQRARVLEELRAGQAQRSEQAADLLREARERSAERATEARERSRQLLESLRSSRSRTERAAAQDKALAERLHYRDRGRGEEESARNRELQTRLRQMEERTQALERRLEQMQRRLDREAGASPERPLRVDPTRRRLYEPTEPKGRAALPRKPAPPEPVEKDPTQPDKPAQP